MKRFTRVLALVLCAVMLLGIVAMIPVQAAEPEATQKTVQIVEQDENGQFYTVDKVVTVAAETAAEVANETVEETSVVHKRPTKRSEPITAGTFSHRESGEYPFETFEELKNLAADTYDGYSCFYYTGTDAFLIPESLTLPENVALYFFGVRLMISSGATLTLSGEAAFGTLDVFGTLNASGHISLEYGAQISGVLNATQGGLYSNGSVYISGVANVGYINVYGPELTITGALNTEGISLALGTVLTGRENIHLVYEWGKIYREAYVTSQESLMRLPETLANLHPSDALQLVFTESFTITESITIPNRVSAVNFSSAVTVAAGATLTFECETVHLYAPLTIEGTLVTGPQTWVCVWYDYSGLLKIGASGSYSFGAPLQVYSDTLSDLALAVPGLDLSEFQIWYNNDEWSKYWDLVPLNGTPDYPVDPVPPAEDLIQLGTPTDLKWGWTEEREWDHENDVPIVNLVEGLPGSISWKTAEPDQSQAYICVYNSNDELVREYWWSFNPQEQQEYRAIDSFVLNGPESGTYYFTVTSEGDGIQYANSETAVSGMWTYVKPNAKLDSCSNLRWNGDMYASWDSISNTDNLYCYLVRWYYGATADAEPQIIGSSWGGTNTDNWTMPEFYIQENGAGYYYFSVRPISSDLTTWCNGDWSELSEAFFASDDNLTNRLDDILNNGSLSVEEKIEAIQSLDSEELRQAMLLNDRVVDQIAALENQAGGAAGIAVSQDVSAFDASQVSIIGANLNDTVNDGQGVTLVIDRPEQNHVLDALYDSSVAVRFSMDLANVADTENLQVPVQITMPVPENINPQFLVILHYHANGTVEEIHPYLYTANGRTYAQFVLTSFSDFVITQLATNDGEDDGEYETVGDLNGDGIVTDDDVALLLWYTLFPNDFEIQGYADFTDDGIVTDDDVAYLLWHTLFPEDFPLGRWTNPHL